MQRILGWLLAPVVWLLGIPWSEATSAGQLLGTKVVLNELVAYVQMAELPPGSLSERSSLDHGLQHLWICQLSGASAS